MHNNRVDKYFGYSYLLATFLPVPSVPASASSKVLDGDAIVINFEPDDTFDRSLEARASHIAHCDAEARTDTEKHGTTP